MALCSVLVGTTRVGVTRAEEMRVNVKRAEAAMVKVERARATRALGKLT